MAFPDNNRTFTTKVDIQDTIYADHVNVLQTEVRAISEAVNGTDPATNGNILQSTYTGTWTANTTWTSLVARLKNIETGLVNGFASSAYIRKSGGDTIEPASGTIPLTLKTNAGSADLFVTKNSSNANGFRVDSTGIPYVNTAKIIYVGSTEYSSLALAANVLKITGGDTVTPPSGTVGMTIKTTAGTSDIFVTKDAANANGFRVDYAGIPYVGTAKVIYVGSPEYNNIPTSGGDNVSAFLLGGM